MKNATTPSGEILFRREGGGGVAIYVANSQGELRIYERLTTWQWLKIVAAMKAEAEVKP